ncbi:MULTISPECIES: tyrosine-type recombinase/integrase [Deefgea]|uniref:Tyrosine-type recombinase/integrase n=1 Tax=Deefgea chitinilytica TaxID=570276 RepID=A0ABS2CAY0_9NEIS|nr:MULTISPECIES: site-specific integrase [Deefgea]MBM5570608.1 tyrosine-type recombinase/integrase [Deefgea chitinilytica]MBM9887837.1 tyrosine-type recombinase/integrase [Deefgea sp. CFH1-16]
MKKSGEGNKTKNLDGVVYEVGESGALTNAGIGKLTSANIGKHTDGFGLYLEVTKAGAKLFRYRYRLDGKENTYALGRWVANSTSADADTRKAAGLFTLKEARAEVVTLRALVAQGTHPSHAKGDAKRSAAALRANTFEAVATHWMESNVKKWSQNYARQVRQRLTGDVFPAIGKRPLSSISTAAVEEVLRTVQQRSEAQAKLVRIWITGAINHGRRVLKVQSSAMTDDLVQAFTYKTANSHSHLEGSAIARIFPALDTVQHQHPLGVIAVKLLAMTVLRGVELLDARWSEVDFDAALLRVPAERMKARKPHIVPLSSQAIALLTTLRGVTYSGDDSFVFVGRSGRKPLTGSTLRNVLRQAGFSNDELTPHGLRGTFSTWANECGLNFAVIETCLAHTVGSATSGAYNHASYIRERREVLQTWADYLQCGAANVVPLFGGKAA